ncbi:hypothetical protein [Streptomyces sp. UNOC14_S4]|uniref:hypothetical protein n=1 Tax=Streptomyces sp. UNOC14_S4 TaxID=2872340 RepID=UPI001E5887EA|nr:hypothetical protein [Streptomyces sp. UNOC14_S4]MCC3767537.1 hypothetical protein [Streptomyces sp. UNOC14_S4]
MNRPADFVTRLSRQFFAATTIACLLTALGICVWWLYVAQGQGSHFEPATSGLALVAAITGVYAERRAAARERRAQTLHALADELARNTELLDGEGFAPMDPAAPKARVYPRLLQSATDAALVSGAFSEPGHDELVALLHRWRDAVHDFNRRLDLTELRSYVGAVPAEELLAIDAAMHREGGQLEGVRRVRSRVAALLCERYGEVAARLLP